MLILLVCLVVLLAVQTALLAHERWSRRKRRAPKDAIAREHVRVAVQERMAHEAEQPHRYPPEAQHRHVSTLQRAQASLRADGHPEPAHLEQLVAAALREHR